ncbi:MAG: winged helix-turn-helix domain-containing protein [Myxococcota bacterium]|nr:winged helix-turn-helix domain-containing protein [Myxococcota bacterium]
MSKWTFLSNHTHVLMLVHQDPDLRMRDIAERVGITERAVQRILHDLVEDGYVQVTKSGRRNHYSADLDQCLRHPLEEGVQVRHLLRALCRDGLRAQL